ncbi:MULTISPECIES: hypothetical protein [Chryseobacterium]|jgi:hypothetical protein|uniref:AtpZ/AtpI family protein n=1 Tax=Chryseobacterium nepalense TaxID=1854498 RepID=A0ABY4K1H4_9FLAO|nr:MULTISPECIES: hypothetical protein [Chryseobacterium]MEA1850016.1 hypothetical protein [Chryseobacterium sp. MHB01]MEC5172887.1 hypothetical protein [Chryseobacterium nepalense]UPQ74584.1 hypothetical protein M0D58_11025 [Chryseobacterium nepalense]
MKTILENNYSYAQQLIIALVSSFFGYHLYQEIVNPEKSQLTLSIMLVAVTCFVIDQYGRKSQNK